MHRRREERQADPRTPSARVLFFAPHGKRGTNTQAQDFQDVPAAGARRML